MVCGPQGIDFFRSMWTFKNWWVEWWRTLSRCNFFAKNSFVSIFYSNAWIALSCSKLSLANLSMFHPRLDWYKLNFAWLRDLALCNNYVFHIFSIADYHYIAHESFAVHIDAPMLACLIILISVLQCFLFYYLLLWIWSNYLFRWFTPFRSSTIRPIYIKCPSSSYLNFIS